MAASPASPVMFAPASGLKGVVRVPADKSISHRAAIIGSICDGPVAIQNFLAAADTRSTLSAIAACGVEVVNAESDNPVVKGAGLRGLATLMDTIDIGNSGTSIRLLPGILAGQSGSFRLDGDESIRRRPMDRVVNPLREMGVSIEARDGSYAPLTVTGGSVHGITYEMPVASAQVKSALLLAGLYADGPTEVIEPAVCRDHTEVMLDAAGARVEKEGLLTRIYPAERLSLDKVEVMGDFSSAAFWLVAGTIVHGSEITLKGVGINTTRTGLLTILLEMGADITLENERRQGGEAVADLTVRHAKLHGLAVGGGITGRMIDELPLLALAGAFADGETLVTGAAELRVKESDRITGLVDNLASLGVHIEAFEDGFLVRGIHGPLGGNFRSYGDHRMAMLGAVAGLASRDGVQVDGFDCVSVSYPNFLKDLESLGALI
ncbi:MAG: 3-phosphoshikimate 1-carboxyvinyltransferase [Thermoleophilia bacterium]|nr:3-phosphoshikimate 1-carboxyvinyltransferase [Thermoleophilia bacterium]